MGSLDLEGCGRLREHGSDLELAFVVVPGVSLTAALMRWRFMSLETVAVGVAVGYALEVLAATGSSVVAHRGLLLPYPAAALAVAFIVRWHWPPSFAGGGKCKAEVHLWSVGFV